MSNAIREIKKFIKAYYPIKRDTNKSAYLGDLLVTGYSQYSRNRTLGAMLGKGYSTKSALMEMQMIAEGYYAADSIHQLNEELGVSMPILDFVYGVIYENKNVKEEAIKLTTLLN
jgi:glycerol-3-phosphate dehydrogenase (NAD(P)+)